MKKITLLIFSCFSLLNNSFGQDLQRMLVDVFQNNVQLVSPFSGGLKSPQFSKVDLNGDGTNDLFVFDRAGNVILTFINRGTKGEVDYVYAPYYSRFFPELAEWALLRDYDGDGIMDIFAQNSKPGVPGVEVYKGSFVNNHIEFTRFNFSELSNNIIPIATNGGFTQLYISGEDVPAFDDLNGDGDLDILTFSDAGGLVYYYENQSIENGWGRDSLKYRRVDNCWGRFYESGIDNCLITSGDPDTCAIGFTSNGVHPGSTLLTFDIDNDGDKELLLGDISFTDMTLAYNDGTIDLAYVENQDCNFPEYDVPVDIFTFPSSFMLDVDNDGLKDLVATSNSDNIGVSFKSIWYYKNTNSNELPVFALQTKNFMIDEMLQFGLGANPTFVDYNEDGLLDIVVGNQSLSVMAQSNLFLLQNIGTATEPAFEVIDEDWLGFRDLFANDNNHYNFKTTFGDIDGDGDKDLFVGDHSGTILFAENTAGPGNAFAFGPLQGDYMGIDIGQLSAPKVIDLDKDGLLDLVIGERTVNVDPNDDTIFGNINFFKNIGTVTEPMFDPDPEAAVNNPYLGRVVNVVPGSGLSATRAEGAPAFFDTGDDFLLFVGSISGQTMLYDNIVGNLDGTFNEIDRNYGNLMIGIQSHLDVADLNNDGFIDMIVGNKRGGLNLYGTNYRTDGTLSTTVSAPLSQTKMELFPNPATSQIQLLWSTDLSASTGQLRIFDALGRQMMQQQVSAGQSTIAVDSWARGIYFMELIVEQERVVKRFVVSK